jgi:hypothetical protein
MRVGVVILPQFRWPEARARWVSLEQRGFAHGWTHDHLAWRDLADEPMYATIPTLIAAATATSTLRLGTWVASPNYRHPRRQPGADRAGGRRRRIADDPDRRLGHHRAHRRGR